MAEQYPDSYYKTPFKFSGKEMDEETGLHYFGARYYDSRSSIWLSVDPLAESFPNWNPYNYTMQNPINLVDPTGMYPEGSEGEPKRRNVVIIDGRDRKADQALQNNIKAVQKLDPSVVVIAAKNQKDMINKITSALGDDKIGNLIIAGHGGYDDSSIEIGSTTLKSDSDFRKLGEKLSNFTDGNSQIALTNCHSGGGADLDASESHMKSLSRGAGGATVMAPMTWGGANAERFSNGDFMDFSITKAAFDQIPKQYHNSNGIKSRINSVKYLDTYKIYNPNNSCHFSEARGLYFTKTGSIKY